MAEYYKVEIDGNWLSQDGLEPIEPNLACRVIVEGIAGLAMAQVGPITKAITGKPWKFISDNHGYGVDLTLKIDQMTPSLLSDIIDAIDDANAGDSTVNLILSGGELPNYDLECVPGEPAVTYDGTFTDDRIFNVEIRLTVSSIN